MHIGGRVTPRGRRILAVLTAMVIAVVGLAGSTGLSVGPRSVAAAGLLAAPTVQFPVEFVVGPVTADHLLLGIDEPIDPTSIPDAADFTWHAIVPGPVSSPIPTIPADVPAVGLTFLYEGFNYLPDLFPTGMSLLRLDLGRTVDPSATVYLTYTPGTHPIRNLEGTSMEAFAGIGGTFIADSGIAGIMAPFVDDGLGPDHLMLIALQPFDPALPPASDFTVKINGTPQVPVSITPRIPGNGLAVLDLKLTSPVAAGDTVTLSYSQSATPLKFLGFDAVASFTDMETLVSLPATPSRSTPVGTAVTVAPADTNSGATTTTITFASVTAGGTTTVASGSTGPVSPAGFSLGSPATYYELATTATFDAATVCFSYDPSSFTTPEASLRLLHYVGGSWVDTTSSGYPDTTNHRICGAVTSFSPFAIAGRPPVMFSGFFAPVDNSPTVNSVKAGSAVPVKFGLGGNLGLSIFAPASPSSQAVTCASGATVDAIEQTVSPGAATLSYDSTSNTYGYVWKTDKAWRGCRKLTLAFYDGTTRSATFSFR